MEAAEGQSHLYERIRSAVRSQCKLSSDVLVCAERARAMINVPAAFRTDCWRRNRYTAMPANVALP